MRLSEPAEASARRRPAGAACPWAGRARRGRAPWRATRHAAMLQQVEQHDHRVCARARKARRRRAAPRPRDRASRARKRDGLRAVGEAEHVAGWRSRRPARRCRLCTMAPGRAATGRRRPGAFRRAGNERQALRLDPRAFPRRCRPGSWRSRRLDPAQVECWQRERMVTGTLHLVVAKMNLACGGGSSSVFRRALKACVDSMCTSSMM